MRPSGESGAGDLALVCRGQFLEQARGLIEREALLRGYLQATLLIATRWPVFGEIRPPVS